MSNLLTTRREGNVFVFFLNINDATLVPADVASLFELVTPFLDEGCLDAGETSAILVALEELLTNVGKFGLIGRDARAKTELLVAEGRIEISSGNILFQISDNGVSFDPASFPPPFMPDDPQLLIPGGLGLHMLKQLFTSLRYARKDGQNVSEWVLSRSSS